MKRLAKNFALVVISSIFTILLAEGVLHLVPDLLPIEVRQALNSKGWAHPEIGNLPEPNSSGVIVTRDFESHYKVDENGFRNAGSWPTETDIVVVGDSLVFGYGVDADSAWPQLLSGHTGMDVLNLGLIGASPQQYRKIYETFARPLKPAVVVIGFFARNDFWDADKYATWERSGIGGNYLEWRGFGRPTAGQFEKPLYRIMYALRKRSFVLALLKFGRDALSGRKSAAPTELTLVDGSQMLLHGKDYDFKTVLSEPNNETFELVVGEIRQIRDAALKDGSRLVVLLQPAKEEVYRESSDAPQADATAALRGRLEQLDIEFIDAAPALQELAQNSAPLYFPTDGHPNAEGYAAFAKLVAEYLDAPGDTVVR
jgi:lysophospholipase L1-like esterase